MKIMKRIPAYLIAFLIFIGNPLFSKENNIIPGKIIVLLGSESDTSQLSKELKNIGGVPTHFKAIRTLSHSMHIYVFEFDTAAIEQKAMLSAVKANPLVKIAQFDHTVEQRNTPNDPQFGAQWNLNNTGQNSGTPGADIDALNAWFIATGGLTSSGDTIVVAVIDGGFDITHPDLNFWKNYDEIPNNSIDDDNNGYIDDYDGWNPSNNSDVLSVQNHGTHISGIIGAKGNNGAGVTGINWNVKIMPICTGGSIESDVVAGYSYVMEQRRIYNQTNGVKGAFVVSSNSSFGVNLGQPAAYPLWCAMYDSLGSVGILNAGATANANTNVDVQGDMPSACTSDWLVTVTNTTNTDTKNNQAGYGAISIDLGAPGTSITSTGLSNTYSTLTGTSISTPHVAGTIALMYAVACTQLMIDYKSDPAGIALMIKDSLLGAVDPIAALAGITVTGGRLNLYRSLKAIQNHYSTDTCPGVSIPEYGLGESNFEIKSIYPNPANNLLNMVYSSDENAEICIVNTLGQEIKCIQTTIHSGGIQNTSIDLTGVEQGVYFLSMNSIHTRSNVVKIIIY